MASQAVEDEYIEECYPYVLEDDTEELLAYELCLLGGSDDEDEPEDKLLFSNGQDS